MEIILVIIGLIIGIIFIYIFLPNPLKKTIKPTLDNINKTTYIDADGTCYKYRATFTKCK